jgi:hypothetical protein
MCGLLFIKWGKLETQNLDQATCRFFVFIYPKFIFQSFKKFQIKSFEVVNNEYYKLAKPQCEILRILGYTKTIYFIVNNAHFNNI